MAIEIKVPSPGESITEVEIGSWFVKTGDHVEKDQEIGEIESEKATLPLIADESGEITLLKEEGETVPVGTVVCTIDTASAGKKPEESNPEQERENEVKAAPEPEVVTTTKKPVKAENREVIENLHRRPGNRRS